MLIGRRHIVLKEPIRGRYPMHTIIVSGYRPSVDSAYRDYVEKLMTTGQFDECFLYATSEVLSKGKK